MVRTPYLIQRARIATPLAEKSAHLSKAVGFHYMGSAEFEFGALPKSIRRIEAQADSWICRIVNDIKEGDTPLRVWSALTDEEFTEYVGYLKILRASQSDRTVKRFYTKESVQFEVDRKHDYEYYKTDFWWDISNDVMFGFKKEFMKRVDSHVASSIAYMNEQK
jgi:hypothetical protein